MRRIDVEGLAVPPYCRRCGAPVRVACRNCKAIIPGPRKGAPVGTYKAPTFCQACSAPFPWLDRQGLVHLLGNRLLTEDLDPADRLAISEQLQALADPELDEKEQLRRWRRIADAIPEFWTESGIREVVVQLASRWVRSMLGMP
jgi:hypothetical protein